MRRETYNEVLGLLSELPIGACPNVGLLRTRFPGWAHANQHARATEHTHTHTHINTNTHIYTQYTRNTHTHTHATKHTHHTHTHTHIHTHTHKHTHTACTRAHIRTHTHTYTHAHTHIAHRIAVETFISIYSQEVQYKVIKSNHIHKARVQEYLAR